MALVPPVAVLVDTTAPEVAAWVAVRLTRLVANGLAAAPESMLMASPPTPPVKAIGVVTTFRAVPVAVAAVACAPAVRSMGASPTEAAPLSEISMSAEVRSVPLVAAIAAVRPNATMPVPPVIWMLEVLPVAADAMVSKPVLPSKAAVAPTAASWVCRSPRIPAPVVLPEPARAIDWAAPSTLSVSVLLLKLAGTPDAVSRVAASIVVEACAPEVAAWARTPAWL